MQPLRPVASQGARGDAPEAAVSQQRKTVRVIVDLPRLSAASPPVLPEGHINFPLGNSMSAS